MLGAKSLVWIVSVFTLLSHDDNWFPVFMFCCIIIDDRWISEASPPSAPPILNATVRKQVSQAGVLSLLENLLWKKNNTARIVILNEV